MRCGKSHCFDLGNAVSLFSVFSLRDYVRHSLAQASDSEPGLKPTPKKSKELK